MLKKSTRAILFLVSIATLGSGARSMAETYPTRVIHLVVPLAAGGTSDVTARVLADELSRQLGQSVIVDNKPGGDSIIGYNYVAQSKPDGYTLLLSTAQLFFEKYYRKDVPFDAEKDFVPISQISKFPILMFSRPGLQVKSVKELIDYAKQNPGKLTYGNSGINGGPDLAMRLFEAVTGVSFQSIPYKGGSESTNAAIGNQVDLVAASPTPALNYAKSGVLNALAVFQQDRSALAPDVRGLKEQGVEGVDVAYWVGVFAPAKTPREIIVKLNQAISKAVQRPDIQQKLSDVGNETITNSDPDQFAKFTLEESEKWRKIMQSLGVKPE